MSSTNSRSNRFIVQGSILAISSILVRVIGLLYRIPMINIIGDEGNGIYGYAFNIYNLALILSSYSLPLAVSKLIAARNIKREYRNSYRILIAALLFAIIVGFTFTCLLYFGSDFIANVIYKTPEVAYPLKVLAPTIFVFSLMGVFRGFFQGKNTMIPTAISQVLEQIVNAIVSILAAYLFMKAHDAASDVAAYGAAGGTLGTLIGAFTGLVFLTLIFAMYYPSFKRRVYKDKTGRVESYSSIYFILFMTIVPVILSQSVYQLNNSLDDILFKQIMTSKGLTSQQSNILSGYYSKYILLSNVPISISAALGTAVIPGIVSSIATGNHREVRRSIHTAIKFNMLIAIPSAIGLCILGAPIFTMIFRNCNEIQKNMMVFGSIGILFFALSTMTNSILQAINLMRLPVIHSAIALVIHAGFLAFLLKFTNLGVYGLVIGNVTFPIVICILNWYQIAKNLNYKQEIVRTFMIPLISAGVMGGIAYLVYRLAIVVLHSNTIATIAAIIVAVPVYGICLIIFKGVSENELAALPKGNTLLRVARKFHLM